MEDGPSIGSRRRKDLTPGSFGELWSVALPLILSAGSLSLMFVVDRMFLTWYSTSALAAVTPAGMLHWTAISIVIGAVTYVNTFVAQYEGAGRKDRAAQSVWQGIYLSIAAGGGFVFILPLADSLFALIGHDAAVQRMEVDYFSILCLGAVPITMSAAFSSFYSGRGETPTVMRVNMFVVGVNIVLDYCLIFGKGPFPQMGIRGAALATVIANVMSVTTFAALMTRRCERLEYGFWTRWRFDRELFGRLLRYGLPTGFQFFVDIAAFSTFIFLVGRAGKEQLAATNLAFNLNTLAFIPMLGCGTAVMTLVGKRIGEGRPEIAVRTTWMAFAVTALYMLGFAAVYLFLPDVILYPYAVKTSAAEFAVLRDHAVVLLRFLAVLSVFDGMAIVFGSAVRGAGDTRFSLVYTFLTGWLLMVLPTWICWRWFDGNLLGSWAACTTYICVLGLGLFLRFQAGHWQSMRVIEPTAEPQQNENIRMSVRTFTSVAPPETGLAPESVTLLEEADVRTDVEKPLDRRRPQSDPGVLPEEVV